MMRNLSWILMVILSGCIFISCVHGVEKPTPSGQVQPPNSKPTGDDVGNISSGKYKQQ